MKRTGHMGIQTRIPGLVSKTSWGGEVGYLVGLISQRSRVRVPPLQQVFIWFFGVYLCLAAEW